MAGISLVGLKTQDMENSFTCRDLTENENFCETRLKKTSSPSYDRHLGSPYSASVRERNLLASCIPSMHYKHIHFKN